MSSLKTLSIILLSFATVSCADNSIFVYYPKEFDRKSEMFISGITDIKEVTICTSSLKKNIENESKLAKDECALFGKYSVFKEVTFSKCPLLAPKALIFSCNEKGG